MRNFRGKLWRYYFRNAFKKFSRDEYILDKSLAKFLKEFLEHFLQDILEDLTKESLKKIYRESLEEISGNLYRRFCQRIIENTSRGKSRYLWRNWKKMLEVLLSKFVGKFFLEELLKKFWESLKKALNEWEDKSSEESLKNPCKNFWSSPGRFF